MTAEWKALLDLRTETRAGIDAVRRAIEIAAAGDGAGNVMSKGGRDLVTATDLAIEDEIRRRLTGALGLPVIGEERGGEPPQDGSPYWLLDPLCGTRNFASGVPLYSVNLALVEAEQVTVAVVGVPPTGAIIVAERERGAWMLTRDASRPLTTSDESRTIIIEDGKSKGGRREHAARLIEAAIRADRWDFRSVGSTVALPLLAHGGISAYAVFLVPALHAAAGTLLVTEAGGVISDIEGNFWTLQSDSLIAGATLELQRELLSMARATSGE